MFPFLRDGDVVHVAPCDVEELRVGDIIFYRSGDRLLAHRVVGFVNTPVGRCVSARGDAFLQEDPPVAEEDLLGRVELVSRQRRGGWHQIRLGERRARLFGDLVARSQAAHRLVRWGSRTWLRLAGRLRQWFPASEVDWEETAAEVEKHAR
jgi:hypothetical protein